jgi:hypothetical protein
MATYAHTVVTGSTRMEKEEVKRTGRFLMFFKTEWWETVRTETVGHDIHIDTTNLIERVFVNGEQIK